MRKVNSAATVKRTTPGRLGNNPSAVPVFKQSIANNHNIRSKKNLDNFGTYWRNYIYI